MRRRSFLLSLTGAAAAPLALRLGIARAQSATPAADASPMAGPPPPPPGTEMYAGGLNNPRGLAFGPDGLLYIAEAGGVVTDACVTGPEGFTICYGQTGAVARVDADGAVKRILSGLGNSANQDTGMNATGPHDIAFADTTMVLVTGLGADPKVREALGPIGADLGRLFKVDADGQKSVIADIAGYEASSNPDGGQIDSNPYKVAVLPDGAFAVVDAGGNSLLKVTPDGQISTLAVFKDAEATLPDGSKMPYNNVPDALAISPDGTILTVGNLTGAPFPVGAAAIWSVPVAGGEPTKVTDGFTNIIDIAYGPDGSLYVLEILKGGLANLNPGDPATMAGQLTRIAPDGTKKVVLGEGLVMPTAVAVGPDKMLYVANLGTLAGGASVVRMPLPS